MILQLLLLQSILVMVDGFCFEFFIVINWSCHKRKCCYLPMFMRGKLNSRIGNDSGDGCGVAPPQRSDAILLGSFEKKFYGPLHGIRSVRDLKVNLRPEGEDGSL